MSRFYAINWRSTRMEIPPQASSGTISIIAFSSSESWREPSVKASLKISVLLQHLGYNGHRLQLQSRRQWNSHFASTSRALNAMKIWRPQFTTPSIQLGSSCRASWTTSAASLPCQSLVTMRRNEEEEEDVSNCRGFIFQPVDDLPCAVAFLITFTDTNGIDNEAQGFDLDLRSHQRTSTIASATSSTSSIVRAQAWTATCLERRWSTG